MLNIIKYFTATTILLFLTGCVTAPSVLFDGETANVQSISVVGLALNDYPSALDAYGVQNAAGATGGFIGSLIGGSIDASNRNSREKKLKAIVDESGFNAQDEMEKSLAAALSLRNFDVAFIEAAREKETEYLTAYPSASDQSDAYFDIVVDEYGYLKSGGKLPWRPMMWVKCRLVSNKDNSILMERTIQFNPATPIEGAESLVADETYAFGSFEDLEAEPERALAGLSYALQQTADAIGATLE